MIVTPIKIQGKKTKIISNIVELAKINDNTTWVEPFLGSGEVLFNINPKKAYVSDNNEYVINFYNNIKNKKITSEIVRTFLEKHGKNLEQNGEEYYYKMRDEFNKNHDALYFLFLNRSCFNGIIRFNSKNEFNVPFCKKNNRYSKSMITKIVNQVKAIEEIIWSHGDDWKFVCCDWYETYKKLENKKNVLYYFDPPYIKRYSDYFDKWTEDVNNKFFYTLQNTNNKFLLSNWYENAYRKNENIIATFENSNFIIHKINHFYHVGGKEINRNEIIECIVEKKETID